LGLNDAPTAANLTLTVTGGKQTAPISVLGKARDPDTGDTLSVVAVQTMSTLGATVSINPDGTISYDTRQDPALATLPKGQTRTDTFTYAVADKLGATSTGTVTVTVVGNFVQASSGVVDQDAPDDVQFAALSNDGDDSGDATLPPDPAEPVHLASATDDQAIVIDLNQDFVGFDLPADCAAGAAGWHQEFVRNRVSSNPNDVLAIVLN
jgi:VCBS repeat-containing protein